MNYPIFKTVTIGAMNKRKYLDAFEKAGINVSDYAKGMIEKIEFQKEKQEVQLVKLTVEELEIGDSLTTKEIWDCLGSKGLELCPAETGLALCLSYFNQSKNEWLRVGMEQIADRGGYPFVFSVVCLGDGLWLDDDLADPTNVWDPENKFVFRLSKLIP